MHLERYEFEIFENRYVFASEGPKGKIKKAILYQLVKGGNIPDDQVMSNNGDRQKILSTIAVSVIHFMEQNPAVYIFAAGVTPSRTRLYQMGIAAHFAIITSHFEIEGFIKTISHVREKNKKNNLRPDFFTYQ